MRDLFRETQLSLDDLIHPIFVEEHVSDFQPIVSMPGINRVPESMLAQEVEILAAAGIKAVLLFGVSHNKDDVGSDTWRKDGLVSRMTRIAKKAVPEMLVIVDVCFCEYTEHGHCGVIKNGKLANDATLDNLKMQAVAVASAGADIVAPSGMIDGQVVALRGALDGAGFENVAIMSYSAKQASNFYAPFREAAGSGILVDRNSYQLDPGNAREALNAVLEDARQGADVLLIKPALSSLDLISGVRRAASIPCGAYQVSGEYSMIKFAAQAGVLDEEAVCRETLTAIKRAGADVIVSYFAKQIALNGL